MFFSAFRRPAFRLVAPYLTAAAAPALIAPRHPAAACTGTDKHPPVAAAVLKRPANFSEAWAHKRQRAKPTGSLQTANVSHKWSHRPKRGDSGVARVAPLVLQPPGLDRCARDLTGPRAAAPAQPTSHNADASAHACDAKVTTCAKTLTTEDHAIDKLLCGWRPLALPDA